MFIVVTQNKEGVNLSQFDYWYVRQIKDSDDYAVFAVRTFEVEDIKPYDTLSVFRPLGQYKSKRVAEKALSDINSSILAGEKGFRMPVEEISVNEEGDERR